MQLFMFVLAFIVLAPIFFILNTAKGAVVGAAKVATNVATNVTKPRVKKAKESSLILNRVKSDTPEKMYHFNYVYVDGEQGYTNDFKFSMVDTFEEVLKAQKDVISDSIKLEEVELVA